MLHECANPIRTDLEDFVKAYPGPVDSESLRAVLERWSLSFGDLASNDDPEHFFLANPIWSQLIIRLSNNLYFWPVIGIFHSFCVEMMEKVVELCPDLPKEVYNNQRSAFLEKATELLFRQAFPSAKIYKGSLYEKNIYENDLLIILDSFMLVIEVKSGEVTDLARRGHEPRLKREIGKLIAHASKQSQRFAEILISKRGVHRFPTKHGGFNEIDTSNINKVINLNITLESLGTLSSYSPHLHEAGFVNRDVPLFPTIALADLEIVFKLIEGQCAKMHYLARRAELESNSSYIGDEQDLLAFYFDTK